MRATWQCHTESNPRLLRQLLRSLLTRARSNHPASRRLCGGANGLLQGLEVQMGAGGALEGPQAERLIRQSREMMDEAALWCHRRQTFVQLEAGTYLSTPVQCDVQAQLREMAGSGADVESAVASAHVDASMFRLILQEASDAWSATPSLCSCRLCC